MRVSRELLGLLLTDKDGVVKAEPLRMLRPVRVFHLVRLFRSSARLHGPLLAIVSPSISPSLSLTLPDARPRDRTQGQRSASQPWLHLT